MKVSCVNCHENLLENAKDDNKADEIAKLSGVVQMIGRYMKSIHAQPNKEDQSRTNATCYNCHEAHYIYPKGSPNRNWWRLNLPYACGACHTKELEAYKTSVHGKETLQNGNPKAAICSDCHTTHDVQNPSLDTTRLLITKNCGNCHDEELKSYMGTYHGQVNTLGFAYTAKCFDCHGNHAIKRVDDPASSVHPNNRLQTCQKCHLDATAGFVSFQPHATDHDFVRYPYTWLASKFMLLLLGGVFAFFWTHSALWYFRELRDHQQNKSRPHVRTDALNGNGGEPVVYYRRWPAIWRIAHLCLRHLRHHVGAHGHDAVVCRLRRGRPSSASCSAARASPAMCTASSPSPSSESSSGTSSTYFSASGATGRPSAGSAPIR